MPYLKAFQIQTFLVCFNIYQLIWTTTNEWKPSINQTSLLEKIAVRSKSMLVNISHAVEQNSFQNYVRLSIYSKTETMLLR